MRSECYSEWAPKRAGSRPMLAIIALTIACTSSTVKAAPPSAVPEQRRRRHLLLGHRVDSKEVLERRYWVE